MFSLEIVLSRDYRQVNKVVQSLYFASEFNSIKLKIFIALHNLVLNYVYCFEIFITCKMAQASGWSLPVTNCDAFSYPTDLFIKTVKHLLPKILQAERLEWFVFKQIHFALRNHDSQGFSST